MAGVERGAYIHKIAEMRYRNWGGLCFRLARRSGILPIAYLYSPSIMSQVRVRQHSPNPQDHQEWRDVQDEDALQGWCIEGWAVLHSTTTNTGISCNRYRFLGLAEFRTMDP